MNVKYSSYHTADELLTLLGDKVKKKSGHLCVLD